MGSASGVEEPDEAGRARLDRVQYQVALFARRVEQTRLGALGKERGSMDRAAFLLLDQLGRHGACGVKQLACSLGVDSSTVTRQVAPLVESGLVGRVTDPRDGRAVRLELTGFGRRRLGEVQASRAGLMGRLMRDWPVEDQESFCTLLERFNHAISEYRGQLRDEA